MRARIVDGDTFDIASGDTIRLADVDTPEYYESGYNEASNFLSELIARAYEGLWH